MSNFNAFLSPSQLHDRIRELRQKMEFEGLSSDEAEELQELKETLSESANDFDYEY
ncbi:MAG: hypothetical protein MUE85_21115 [Microscillaceae bacterium]|jgi:hypothetical protein|nr:hypothetical protein [Microscillaceae bacterium]